MDALEIRRNLEEEYDIPFTVQSTFDGGEPAFFLGPKNSGKELFTIKITFRNKVRLYMDFIPEKYSAHFIEAMSKQTAENRNRFLGYATLLKKKGAKADIKVNSIPLDLTSIDAWPENWRDVKIHVTKMPVFENEEDYPSAAYKWGSILIGMILSLTDIVPVADETIEHNGFPEGDAQRIEVNRYERNPLNRKLCLSAKGYDCIICGFNFEKIYGKIGYHFIHVHHVVPVSQLGTAYVINPITDLIPVCPNCHAMLHRRNPPLLPEELKNVLTH